VPKNVHSTENAYNADNAHNNDRCANINYALRATRTRKKVALILPQRNWP